MTLDDVFNQCSTLETQKGNFQRIAIPATLKYNYLERNIPVPSTTNPNATVDEVTITATLTAELNYSPSHILTLNPQPGMGPQFVLVPPSLRGTFTGQADVSGNGGGGSVPTQLDARFNGLFPLPTHISKSVTILSVSGLSVNEHASVDGAVEPIIIRSEKHGLPSSSGPQYYVDSKVEIRIEFGTPVLKSRVFPIDIVKVPIFHVPHGP